MTVAASAGFLVGLGGEGVNASYVLALMAGGVVAAPLAALAVKRLDPSVLGVVVGALLLATNARTMMLEAGTPGPIRLAVILALVAAGGVVTSRVARTAGLTRSESSASSEPEEAPLASPLPAPGAAPGELVAEGA